MNATVMLQRVSRGLHILEKTILGAGIIGIALLSIVNVLARNFGGHSLAFAEELNQALMVWITFAGVGLGAREARHIRMAAFYDQLQGRARKIAWMCTAAGTALLLILLTGFALDYVISARSIGSVTPALRIPRWIIYTIVPVGLAVGAVEYVLTFVSNVRKPGVHASAMHEEDALEEGLQP